MTAFPETSATNALRDLRDRIPGASFESKQKMDLALARGDIIIQIHVDLLSEPNLSNSWTRVFVHVFRTIISMATIA